MTIHCLSAGRDCRSAAAFTLVEALVALTITAIAASALLLGISSSLQTTGEAMDGAIALGMAQQLLDEIVGTDFDWPEAVGAAGSRASFETVDEYDGYQSQPPTDPWGVPLGYDDREGRKRHPNFRVPPGSFDHWQQRVDVDPANNLVTVRIMHVDPDRGTRELAKLQRVIPDVPE